MQHETTTFDRETLYRQVWAEPVRTVAKGYRIFDVGLRKVCAKLGVPVPPLGFWAKLEAGQKVRAFPLPKNHTGPTTYER